MEKEIKSGGKPTRKKIIIGSILAIVAIGLIIGVYLWRKGRIQTSADVELALDKQEEQEFNADNEELTLPGNEYRVGNNKVALRSGTLVKLENTPEVYLIYRGTKQLITSPDVFSTGLWLKWENILVLPADHSDYLNLYQNGPEIGWGYLKDLPNGWTLRFDGSPTVYSVVEGKLKPYPSPSVFLTRHNWNEVSVLPPSWLPGLEIDKTLFRFRGGNLVKSSDSDTVYWVAGAKKLPVDSPAEMERWGLRWENIITVEPGFLESKNPESNKPMYATGRDTSQFKRNFLPGYLWKRANYAMVYLFLYDNGAKDLQFVSAQVFTNRFNWSEISYQHPARHTSPSPSASSSTSTSPSNSASPFPSGSVKCTTSGHAYNTDWQQIPLTDYARSTFPQGLNKMYEVTRVDGTNNPPRTKMQVIFNIKNITNPNSNRFASGDQIQTVTDIYFVQGAYGNTILHHGQFDLFLIKNDNSGQVAHWLLDDNEFPSKVIVGNHYQINTHNPTYTLPANIDYTKVKFAQKYRYLVSDSQIEGGDTCHWPASGETLTVFDQLSQ